MESVSVSVSHSDEESDPRIWVPEQEDFDVGEDV